VSEKQKETFTGGEGDAYFERNRFAGADAEVNEWDELIAGLLDAGDRVLEIGCSDGRRLAAISSLRPELGSLVGIDPSAAAVSDGRLRWPHLDLRLGTADRLPLDQLFDLIIFGFCLYLCDRDDLPRIVANADHSLSDGGSLVIIDFDPAFPSKRTYAHRQGVWSYKMDYAAPFLAFPSYSLVEKRAGGTAGLGWHHNEGERTALTVLRKDNGLGYCNQDSD